MFRENDLSPHNSDNDECIELWVLLVCCLCLAISTSKMATVGGWAERRSAGMHWVDGPGGSRHSQEQSSGVVDSIRQRKSQCEGCASSL